MAPRGMNFCKKNPLKLLSSTFTPSLPFSLFLSPHASPASSELAAAPCLLAFHWSSRTPHSPPPLEFAASAVAPCRAAPWRRQDLAPPVVHGGSCRRDGTRRPRARGDRAREPRPRDRGGGRQAPPLSRLPPRPPARLSRHERAPGLPPPPSPLATSSTPTQPLLGPPPRPHMAGPLRPGSARAGSCSMSRATSPSRAHRAASCSARPASASLSIAGAGGGGRGPHMNRSGIRHGGAV